MHERSLVRALLAEVGELLNGNGAHRVKSIRVNVGEFSGVEPELFRLAFADMTGSPPFKDAVLELATVALEARCQECDHLFRVASFRFDCPRCGGTRTVVVRGEELMLESVTIEDAQS